MYYLYRNHFSLDPIVFKFYWWHGGLGCLEWWLYMDSLLVSQLLGVSASKRKKKIQMQMHDTWLDWTLQNHMRTVLYLGVIGLHRTNSTLPQQPRVKGFAPSWNFLVICKEEFLVAGQHWILSSLVFRWTITHFPRLTCSFVVRPVTTRTIWKHANPITGMKKRPDRLMMDRLTQWCQRPTFIKLS